MYEVHHTIDDLEKGKTVLWNGREYIVTELTDDLLKLSDTHTIDIETAQRWFKSEDMPFEIVY